MTQDRGITAPIAATSAGIKPRRNPETVFIACAALGKEVRELISKHRWNADLRVINARFHMTPERIGPAVDAMLTETAQRYKKQVVIYGHCGADDLDGVVERHGAVRTLGPHCYEMFGGQTFVDAVDTEPGTFMLTDFLVKAWEPLVVEGLKLDEHPELKDVFFANYTRLMYLVQEHDETLVSRAGEIADWLGLPLEVVDTGYGDLEGRLVAIMAGAPQPTTPLTGAPDPPVPAAN